MSFVGALRKLEGSRNERIVGECKTNESGQ